MNNVKPKFIIAFSGILIFIITWSYLMLSIGPQRMVDSIGISNGYLIGFLIALFGGLSTITSPSLYATTLTLVAGGLNPVILGLVLGIALFLGDSLFFILGANGRKLIPYYEGSVVGKFSRWLKKQNSLIVSLVSFIYIGLSPFPNDIFMIASSVAKFPYKKIVVPLILGDLVFALLITLGFSLF